MVATSSARWLPEASNTTPALYLKDALERVHVQAAFGQQFLELGVLTFKLTQLPGVGHIHATDLQRHS